MGSSGKPKESSRGGFFGAVRRFFRPRRAAEHENDRSDGDDTRTMHFVPEAKKNIPDRHDPRGMRYVAAQVKTKEQEMQKNTGRRFADELDTDAVNIMRESAGTGRNRGGVEDASMTEKPTPMMATARADAVPKAPGTLSELANAARAEAEVEEKENTDPEQLSDAEVVVAKMEGTGAQRGA